MPMPPAAPAGPTLRLTQWAEGSDKFKVDLALEGPNLPRQTATSHFQFALSLPDQERIRWYLETYLQEPFDPNPIIAAGVEESMAAVGKELFGKVFESTPTVARLWATLEPHLNDTRVEIVTGVREATTIPWELLRDSTTGDALALRAHTFVRAHANPSRQPQPLTATRTLRILLIIARPRGENDVAFRSVALRLVDALSQRDDYQLDVLRPPTFAALDTTLRAAYKAGQPYHVVHFDGHGAYLSSQEAQQIAKLLAQLNPQTMGAGSALAMHGHLVFERIPTAQTPDVADAVGGVVLGQLLAATGVPVLVLNACRSAHAERAADPTPDATGEAAAAVEEPALPADQVRAYGSLAQEVMDQGVSGVVAMRYNVYVKTAAAFVGGLYSALAEGNTLGEAATSGRKGLAADPRREIGRSIRLQDWSVPVIYEAAPIALFRRPGKPGKLTPPRKKTTTGRGDLDPELLKRPVAGFYGRDETLLALDRVFDTQRIVLLHAYAGSGKTATAAEFARWYAGTGGVAGPVLYTSFERRKPLALVLDQLGQLFEPVLAQSNIQWLALDEAGRRSVALQLLQAVPVLWIWDNVEPVAGFPAGTESAWSAAEQAELVGFLRAARDTPGTQAKFLLTSRRDEQGWLGGLPTRIIIPPMPMQERSELALALARHHGGPLPDLSAWQPLLRFTAGNPLALTVVVGQALRERLTTVAQVEAYVAQLRAGTAQFADEQTEGRDRSLGASLSYGFAHAFSEAERAQLALLHLFQGWVDVDTLRVMGYSEDEWCLSSVRGLTRETGITLLNRAAEIGLLISHDNGYYSIHPALPWYFHSLFVVYYPTAEAQLAATRAFVAAVGYWGDYYHQQYNEGNQTVVPLLAAEEANLRHAWHLARQHGWWDLVLRPMQGLQALYDHTARRGAWARLVADTVPDFVDPAEDGSLPGREDQWDMITQYRVDLAQKARQWVTAERLQRRRVEWDRQQAAPLLALSKAELTSVQRNTIRTLGASLLALGQILREQNSPDCVPLYEEVVYLNQHIEDRAAEAIAAFNLGHAYMEGIPAIRDLAQAEHWYRRSLDLRAANDRLGRAKTIDQIGMVLHAQFRDARKAGASVEQLKDWANKAAQAYLDALDLSPPDAFDKLAIAHSHLGDLYGDVGDLSRALPHYNDAIRYFEAAENPYYAHRTRYNVAIDLQSAGRFDDALLFAQAALRGFTLLQAADEIQETQGLIDLIKQAQQQAKGDPTP
ncbi:MAG: CHAT domain-containing protein [Chloroflexota bacterium]|nr:CHAT domain-containing protein [Chloroflexota bacterium]